MSNEPVTVAILGAGVGGLTVAHELARRGFRVRMFERNPEIGGLARSKNFQGLPVEHGWRGYGPMYFNLREVMGEIPTPDGRNAHDHLMPLGCVNPRNEDAAAVKSPIIALRGGAFTAREKWFLLDRLFTSLTSCAARNESLDDVSWADHVYRGKRPISDEAYKFAVHSLGPYLGFTSEGCNVPVVTQFGELMTGTFPKQRFDQMSMPTSEAWFDPWHRHLESLGVEIRLRTNVVELLPPRDGAMSGFVVDGPDGRETITADFYVCALPIEAAAKLFDARPEFARLEPALAPLSLLAQRGRQVMLAVQYFLDRKVTLDGFGDHVGGVYLPDSPWSLMLQLQGMTWGGRVDLAARSGGRVRDVWSVGICVVDQPGIVVKKPFVECTAEEVERETWAQILACKALETVARPSLRDVNVLGFYMWDSFSFRDGRMDTNEPKWTDNVGTLRQRPPSKTRIRNLTLATAYTRTEMHIFCMEGACEAGRRAAAEIVRASGAACEPVNVRRHTRPWPLVFGPLRAVDGMLHRAKLPHLGSLLGGALALLGVYAALLVVAAVWLFS